MAIKMRILFFFFYILLIISFSLKKEYYRQYRQNGNYIEKANLNNEKYTTHKLRHTAATLMHQNGVDIRVLQEVLGHANLGTTQIYTHLENKQIQDAMKSNPLASVQIKKEKLLKDTEKQE